jgi:sulfite reductase (ferredoxin)
MGSVYAQGVRGADIASRLRPVFELFRAQRASGEEFGDFCSRMGVEALVQAATPVGSHA